MDKIKNRFLRHVEKTDTCWLWTGAILGKGYGAFKFSGKTERTNRVSYKLFVGEVLTGMHVLHSCDNPPCVNPEHLFLGTHSENMQDMISKGRQKKRQKKFTEEEQREKRRLFQRKRYNHKPRKEKLPKEHFVAYQKKYYEENKERINLNKKRRYYEKKKLTVG